MVDRDATLTSLFAQAPDAIILADLHGVIEEWNGAAERIFGYTSAEAVGKSLDLIIPEQFREAHWRGYDHALATGTTKFAGQPLPTRSARKDGATIYVELTFAIIHDADGVVRGALAHARDISERWLRDREQRRELARLRRDAS